jgi:hypothetical protein
MFQLLIYLIMQERSEEGDGLYDTESRNRMTPTHKQTDGDLT